MLSAKAINQSFLRLATNHILVFRHCPLLADTLTSRSRPFLLKLRVPAKPGEQFPALRKHGVNDLSAHRAPGTVSARVAEKVAHTPLPTHLGREEGSAAEIPCGGWRHGGRIGDELFVEID